MPRSFIKGLSLMGVAGLELVFFRGFRFLFGQEGKGDSQQRQQWKEAIQDHGANTNTNGPGPPSHLRGAIGVYDELKCPGLV